MPLVICRFASFAGEYPEAREPAQTEFRRALDARGGASKG
jgi:hypothetical protein